MQNQKNRPASDDILFRTYLPLVGHACTQIAGRAPSHIRLDDLVAAGLLGLMEAVGAAPNARVDSFTDQAISWIRRSLLDEVRQVDWSSRRLPTVASQVAALRPSLGIDATTADFAYEMGIDRQLLRTVVAELTEATRRSVVGSAGTMNSEPIGVGGSLEQLPPRLRRVLIALFFDGRAISDLAIELGISDIEVGALRSEALARLRGVVHSDHPAEEIGASARPQMSVSSYAAVATAGEARLARDSAAEAVAERIALSALTG